MTANYTKVHDHSNDFLKGRARRHAFTWFNYTEDDVNRLKSFTKNDVDFLCFGHELTTEGGAHLQGYVEWNRGVSGYQMLKTLLGRNKISPCPIRGSVAEKVRAANVAYCSKDESADPAYPTKYFELAHKIKSPGARTDIYNDLMTKVEDGATLVEIAREFPEQALKHTSGLQTLITAFEEDDALQANKAELLELWKCRKWQHELIEMVKRPSTDRRHIYWFWDAEGNKGKSELANYLELFHDAEVMTNGKYADVVHGWRKKPIVIFDFARDLEDRINYGVLEAIKNNRAFSTKYNSGPKRGRGANHVIVFANYPPDRTGSKISLDKLIIRHLTEADCVAHVPSSEPEVVHAQPVIVDIEEAAEGDESIPMDDSLSFLSESEDWKNGGVNTEPLWDNISDDTSDIMLNNGEPCTINGVTGIFHVKRDNWIGGALPSSHDDEDIIYESLPEDIASKALEEEKIKMNAYLENLNFYGDRSYGFWNNAGALDGYLGVHGEKY